MMRSSVFAVAASLAFCLPAAAKDVGCLNESGKFIEYVAAPFGSPNDPFGRSVIVSDGTISAGGTSILTSVGPGPTPGTLGATTRHLFVFNEQDQLEATGVAVFTPIPGTADVSETLTLTIAGGVGKFESATGTIEATGTGFNFFPLPPGPSAANNSFFVFKYKGQVCTH